MGDLEGVDVVVDKDLASSVLARDIKADCLIMITGVEHVFLNFKQQNERALKALTVKEAERYLEEGHFPPGEYGAKNSGGYKFLNWSGEVAIMCGY